MRKTISVLIFLIFAYSLYSQKMPGVKYSIEEGLASSQVYDIIQDNYGFIWFSTDKGISRFDGFNFENYGKEDGLTNNTVFDFHKQKNGDIWCTTLSTELFKIKGNPPQFIPHRYNYLFKECSNGQVPHSAFMSEQGDVYISFLGATEYLHVSGDGEVINIPKSLPYSYGFENLKCMLLAEGDKEPFFFLHKLDTDLKDDLPYDLIPDMGVTGNRGEALYFEEGKVGVYFAGHKIAIQSSSGIKEISVEANIIASGKLDKDRFWIGVIGGGAYIYDQQGNFIERFLPDHSVTQIFEDSENHTWVSTLSSGVHLYKKSELKKVSPLQENDRYVNDLSSDCYGNLYVGYYNGNIYKYNKREGLTSFHKTSTFGPAVIHNVKDSCLSYYCSGNHVFKNNTFVDSQSLRNLYSGNGQVFFLSTNNHTYVKSENDSSSRVIFKNTRLYDIQFFNDRFYAGGEKGLYYIKKGLEKKVENNPFLLNPIRSLDNIGSYLLIGTKGKGVGLLSSQGEIVLNLKKENGLSGDLISNLYVENDSVFWVCTNKGLSKVILLKDLEYEIINLNEEESPLTLSVEDIEILNDTIWIGTQTGLYTIAKNGFAQKENTPQKIFLSTTINNKLIETNITEFVSADEIEFSFKSPASYSHSKPMYRYKLSEIDEDWKYTLEHNACYGNLPVGNYTFRIQFCNANRCWSNTEREYTFSIVNLKYSHWKAGLLALFVSGTLIYLFIGKPWSNKKNRQILQSPSSNSEKIIHVKHMGAQISLNTKDILFVKSAGNYLELHTATRMYLMRMGMNEFLKESVECNAFARVHRSYGVRLDKIDKRNSQKIWVDDHEIPIGRVYKNQLN